MAGQAAKKRAENAAKTGHLYLIAVLTSFFWYVPVRIIWYFDSFTLWPMLGFCMLTIVGRFTYMSIVSAMEMGVDYEYYQDIFIINLVVTFLSPVWAWAWYIYLLIPAYLIYKFGGYFKGWAFAPAQEEEVDEKEAKRLAKKERQQNQVKYQKMR